MTLGGRCTERSVARVADPPGFDVPYLIAAGTRPDGRQLDDVHRLDGRRLDLGPRVFVRRPGPQLRACHRGHQRARRPPQSEEYRGAFAVGEGMISTLLDLRIAEGGTPCGTELLFNS